MPTLDSYDNPDLYVSRYAETHARKWNGERFERDGVDGYGAVSLIRWVEDSGGRAWFEPERSSMGVGTPARIIVSTNSGPALIVAGWWIIRGTETFRPFDQTARDSERYLKLLDHYPCDPATFERRWRTPPTFPESWAATEAYRRRVRAATGCEFCGAAAGEPCTYYNDPSAQRGDLVPLSYIHDDRSAWYDVMVRTGQTPAAAVPMTEPVMLPHPPPNECHGGDVPHEFTPGVSEDDPDHPDPSWCNTCGEPHQPAP